MKPRIKLQFVVVGLSWWLAAVGTAVGDAHMGGQAKKVDYASMSAEDLAEHFIFEEKGFDLDQKTQEGTTMIERLRQDEIQKTCSALKGGDVDSKSAERVQSLANEQMRYPESGVKLGDWKKGEALALSGYGFRVGQETDNHEEQAPGGNCQACHQLDPNDIAYGTLGPSLTNYGQRGTSEEILKYTYGVIYNPHSVFPCTRMPRFGHNAFLTAEQIQDIMAYLMSPESPVNKP